MYVETLVTSETQISQYFFLAVIDPMQAILPIKGMCEFRTSGLSGEIQRNSMLCTLPLNFLNQKILLGLWFWFAALLLLSVLLLIAGLIALCFPGSRQ